MGSQGGWCACLEASYTHQSGRNPTHSVSMMSLQGGRGASVSLRLFWGWGQKEETWVEPHWAAGLHACHPQDRPGEVQERRLLRTRGLYAPIPCRQTRLLRGHWLSSCRFQFLNLQNRQ